MKTFLYLAKFCHEFELPVRKSKILINSGVVYIGCQDHKGNPLIPASKKHEIALQIKRIIQSPKKCVICGLEIEPPTGNRKAHKGECKKQLMFRYARSDKVKKLKKLRQMFYRRMNHKPSNGTVNFMKTLQLTQTLTQIKNENITDKV